MDTEPKIIEPIVKGRFQVPLLELLVGYVERGSSQRKLYAALLLKDVLPTCPPHFTRKYIRRLQELGVMDDKDWSLFCPGYEKTMQKLEAEARNKRRVRL